MAHSNYEQLCVLLECLDDERNDLYLHLDRKFELSEEKIRDLKTAVKRSHLYLVPRYSIAWGGFSLVSGELAILKQAATKADKYSYIHLLSGLDLPIKNQDYIHSFFTEHKGEEFVEFMDEGYVNKNLIRMKYYYPLQEFAGRFRKESTRKKLYRLQRGFVKIQKLIRVNRLRKNPYIMKAGSQWFSITAECARYIADNAGSYIDMFKHCDCADEYFIQTIIANSEYYSRRHIPSRDSGSTQNMRLIVWEDSAHPITFTMEDYERIMDSDLLFARKFDEKTDNQIIEKVSTAVRSEDSMEICRHRDQ